LRRSLANAMEKRMRINSQAEVDAGIKPDQAGLDRLEVGISILRSIERALARGRLSRQTVLKVLRILAGGVFINKGGQNARTHFMDKFEVRPPEILLISPTKGCNLRCEGCYADSKADPEKISWPILDHMIEDVKNQFGARFIALSGGEPLAYKDQGNTILDLVEKHPECFFLMYTNGTLIDDATAERMGNLGNIIPAISVEGLKESTDRRRGDGIFDQILEAMERLKKQKVLFGISMTATRENAEEILSDDVINFFFEEMGALLGWIFQYMPIGRAKTLDLLPTPEQRLWMWQKNWELIKQRNIFLVDFWNGGSVSSGCIGAGRSGGYFSVNWSGDVTSCAFMPYSPLNVNEVFAEGKTFLDIWQHPFFARIRGWQDEYGFENRGSKDKAFGNWMMPCPIRDHYAEFYEIQKDFELKPVDENAREALLDPEYREGLKDYNKEVAALFDPIWDEQYLNGKK
ncbi:MAG: radical SAM protein, partial [Candidatus Aminicenantes bacterium]|nr:radical SAM protein [Candidatus Aminicenantes bacterium]